METQTEKQVFKRKRDPKLVLKIEIPKKVRVEKSKPETRDFGTQTSPEDTCPETYKNASFIFIRLPAEIFCQIFEYLTYFEKLVLKRAYPPIIKEYSELLWDSDELERWFQKVRPKWDFDRFCIDLMYHRALYVGGSLLNFLVAADQDWKSDVDIVATDSRPQEIVWDCIIADEEGVQVVDTNIVRRELFGQKGYVHTTRVVDDSDYAGLTGIRVVKAETHHDKSYDMDIIIPESDKGLQNSLKYVKEEFDLDFCKVAFDGQHIKICDWGSVARKHSIMSVKICNKCSSTIVRVPRLEKRAAKYEKRGFHVGKYIAEGIEPPKGHECCEKCAGVRGK